MASPPNRELFAADERRDAPPRERNLGEHIFIWVAWALAAAFWCATLTALFGILRDARQPVAAPAAPGAPGGMGYLGLVVAAFLVFGLVLAYASWRTARGGSPDQARGRDDFG